MLFRLARMVQRGQSRADKPQARNIESSFIYFGQKILSDGYDVLVAM